MLKMTVLGEKLMKAVKGGDMCCWKPGSGCDCSSSGGDNFTGSSEVWLGNLETAATP